MRGEMRRWGYWGKGWNKENKADILERTRQIRLARYGGQS